MKKLIIILLFNISLINIYSLVPLYKNEIKDLEFISEELKVNRDLYNFLFNEWEVNFFESLAQNKDSDIKYILKFLEEYNLDNFNFTETPKEYNRSYFKKVYETFSEKGNDSELDGLVILVTQEEMFIKDLNEYIELSQKRELTRLYEKLKQSSIYCIREVNKYLYKKYRYIYKGKYLSTEELGLILLN